MLPFEGADIGAQPAHVGQVLSICARVAGEIRERRVVEHDRAYIDAIRAAAGGKR